MQRDENYLRLKKSPDKSVQLTSIESTCFISSPNFTFDRLLESSWWNDSNKWSKKEFGEEVLECVETATKEAKIEKKLKMISEVWAGLCLDYKQYKETDIMMILVSEEVMEALETHQMELQSMIGMGKFVEFFKKEVSEWQKTLGNVEETLKVWNIVMKAWASLESIFLESADIRNQLPDDTKRFEGNVPSR